MGSLVFRVCERDAQYPVSLIRLTGEPKDWLLPIL
jgi:hypothetical protein